MSIEDGKGMGRRAVLCKGGLCFFAIGLLVTGVRPALGKAKSAKDDFFFQEEPGDDGKKCNGCINFAPKGAGQYGADSGDCALLEGDVCTHCYCQGWTDKSSASAKKAGT